MPKTLAILALAGISVIAAMFACLLFVVHVISGNIATGLLWLGVSMFAILFAIAVVVLNGTPERTDDLEQGDDDP